MTILAEDCGPPPLGLYVHLPWCVRKCPYCDFNSHPLRGELPAAEYITALLADLDEVRAGLEGRSVETVFFGGGTPSLFSGPDIGRLLDEMALRLDFSADVEITLEANPGTVERDAFPAYRAAGVNRVSLGVQSFDDGLLAALGRIHGRADVERALASLDEAGIENFNIDLMYGLPGQSAEQALADLEAALRAGPAHLSHYQLTLEPNTEFARQPPDLPDDEQCWAMQEAGAEALTAAGFGQYEVSAWARPGRHCRHNLNYWRYGDFIGIGAGAHSKLTRDGRVERWSRPRQPRVYLGGALATDRRCLPEEELVFEFFLNALRLREGFDRRLFTRRTGLDWSVAATRVDAAAARGLLEVVGQRIRPTDLGWRFVNETQALFLP